VFLERRLSVAESGSVEDDLRLVLILPDELREDRFALGPQAFDGRTDGGANDLGIELVVVMADQVAHACHVGPRDVEVALTQVLRQGLDGLTDREDTALDSVQGYLRDIGVAR